MTDTFGLVGRNIAYSRSQIIAEDFFKAHNIDAEYKLFDIDKIEQIQDIIDENPNLRGFNVTIPYKEQIIPYLDDLEEAAAKIGAVNCVKVVCDGTKCRLYGFNTDYIAFMQIISELVGKKNNNSALILGTGGAAKAVAYAFSQLNISYKFVSREVGKGNIRYSLIDKKLMERVNIVVNTTPCGTVGFADELPKGFPYDMLRNDILLFDLVYNPPMTPFMSEGQKRGCCVENGLRMLQLQAEMFYKTIFI